MTGVCAGGVAGLTDSSRFHIAETSHSAGNPARGCQLFFLKPGGVGLGAGVTASIEVAANRCLVLLLLRVSRNVTILFPPMRIYLDHNATTPLDHLVADRMALAMREVWGNASSVHHFGQQAKAALDEARGAVAGLLGTPCLLWSRGGQ